MSGRLVKITAPLSGTFYASPSPESPPFVQVGQRVSAGEVLCIIESMKVFTELRTEYAGAISQIFMEDEDPVTRNQELIELELD
jgi:biotin carboxyl carrier protein